MLDQSAVDSFYRYPVEQNGSNLTTVSVLPVLLKHEHVIGQLRYMYIDQNLQLHAINTFQFTNSSRTTKHHCKHDVTWPVARGSALKIVAWFDPSKMARSFSQKLSNRSRTMAQNVDW